MKGKLVTILFIIVFVLLVAVVISLLNDDQDLTNINDIRIEATQTDTPVLVAPATAQPVQDTPAPTLLPLPTAPPTPTPMPTATPMPTPEPTPTPPPAPMVTNLGGGSFRSNTHNMISLVVDWSVTAVDENRVKVDVAVGVESYSLHLVSARSVHVGFADQFVTLDAPAVTYDGRELARNELAATSFYVDLPVGSSNSYTLAVEWQFGGVYFNQELPVLECGGTVQISR